MEQQPFYLQSGAAACFWSCNRQWFLLCWCSCIMIMTTMKMMMMMMMLCLSMKSSAEMKSDHETCQMSLAFVLFSRRLKLTSADCRVSETDLLDGRFCARLLLPSETESCSRSDCWTLTDWLKSSFSQRSCTERQHMSVLTGFSWLTPKEEKLWGRPYCGCRTFS